MNINVTTPIGLNGELRRLHCGKHKRVRYVSEMPVGVTLRERELRERELKRLGEEQTGAAT